MKGIFVREQCDDYDPMSLDELAEMDEFIRQIFVDDCPVCGSESTTDCDNFLEQVRDITIGTCNDCGAYWCTECGYVFPSKNADYKCPHIKICEKCSQENGYMDYTDFLEQICPNCGRYSNGCQLDPDVECPIQHRYVCPCLIDILFCPEIIKFLNEQGANNPNK